MSQPDWEVAVVGAGVAGCALAFELAARGRRVALLEAGRLGQGASSVPLAILNPHRGRSARASSFDLRGLAAVWELVDRLEALGLDPGARRSGVLRVAESARQAKGWRGREEARWLEPNEVPRSVHAPFGGLFAGAGGWLEPPKLLGALVTAATARGAECFAGWRLEGLERSEGGYLLSGARGSLAAEGVVLCTGATPTPGLPLPAFERSAGDVVSFEPAPPLAMPVAGAVYAGRLEERLYVGGNHRPAERDDPAAPARLREAASWFLPGLEAKAPVSVWTGVRARREGNLPLLQRLGPGLWFMGCFAGRGFLSAPLLARILAADLDSEL